MFKVLDAIFYGRNKDKNSKSRDQRPPGQRASVIENPPPRRLPIPSPFIGNIGWRRYWKKFILGRGEIHRVSCQLNFYSPNGGIFPFQHLYLGHQSEAIQPATVFTTRDHNQVYDTIIRKILKYKESPQLQKKTP